MSEANDGQGLLAGASGRSILILYGTETGHSQEIADELGQVTERLRFRTVVEEMNNAELRDLVRYSLVIFVTSTTGQGDMPRNIVAFWKSLLRKRLPPTCLARLKFTIFGLGDSSYPKFNWAARKLQKRLLQLGATEFYPAGEGDERHDDGIDSIYLPWSQGLKEHLLDNYPLPPPLEPIADEVLLPPKYPLKFLPTMESARHRLDGLTGEALEKEKDALFEEFREKNAALSHVEHPRPASYQLDEDVDRLTYGRGIEHFARLDERQTDLSLQGHRADALDKDNLLTDHPQKYLLHAASKDTPDMPPPIILPIPNTYNAIVTQNKRITPLDHWQDVRHLKLTVKIESENAIPELLPGSTLTIYPKNYPEDAQKLIDLMGWASVADKPIDWPDRNTTSDSLSNPPKRSDPKLSGLGHPPSNLHYLRNSTLRDLLIHNLDITSVPNRTFIKRLAHFTKDEREKERLLELTHADGTQEFYDYTSRPRRTILEVLEDFKNVKIPLDYLLELIPVIRGREFSIANGGLSLKGASGPELITVELVVALVEYKTIIRKPRQGLCSRYIRWLFEDTLIGVSIKTGNPPPCSGRSAKRPLIAIATGTGIAPVRSLIHERDMYNDEEQPVGPQLLFFGCRNRAADFYFADEWARRGVEVRPAFSRDPGAALEAGVALAPPTGLSLTSGDLAEAAALGVGASAQWLASDYDRGKNYVQHVIRRHAARVCELLRRDAVVVLCGNSGRMPVSVRAALLDALVLGGLAKDKDEAEAFFAEVSFWQETW